MKDTETHCHCGKKRGNSDHCDECGCEEYQTTCDHTYSAFDNAVRKMFDVDSQWLVSVEITGGESVQIGDYTWDTEPRQIEVTVFNPGSKSKVQNDRQRERIFDTLPELWEALQ